MLKIFIQVSEYCSTVAFFFDGGDLLFFAEYDTKDAYKVIAFHKDRVLPGITMFKAILQNHPLLQTSYQRQSLKYIFFETSKMLDSITQLMLIFNHFFTFFQFSVLEH